MLSDTIRKPASRCWILTILNDTFGHEASDLVLRELGRILSESPGKSDIACRFGGEEFVLVLFDSPLETGQQHLEMICRSVKEMQIRYREQLIGTITLSIGITEVPDHNFTAEDLLRAADQGFYAAKHAGRDRIVAFCDLDKNQERVDKNKITTGKWHDQAPNP